MSFKSVPKILTCSDGMKYYEWDCFEPEVKKNPGKGYELVARCNIEPFDVAILYGGIHLCKDKFDEYMRNKKVYNMSFKEMKCLQNAWLGLYVIIKT